jgi:DNA-binding transcriptional LysR family regulator
MVDVRRLKVLREVARHGSFSAAATALGYTQPAISRQIAVLEAEMGTQLLLRVPQGVVLTDAGRVLVERGEDVLTSLQRLEDEVRAHADLDGGRLRLAVFSSAAVSLVPRALVRYRQLHPGVELSVIVADPSESLPLLRGGELDLALCHYAQSDAASVGLECVPLLDDPMYIAFPPGHPLADVPTLTLTDLAEESWMLPTLGDRCPDAQLVLVACHAAGFEPSTLFEYDDYAALLGFVAAGVGIAPIPDMIARSVRHDVVMRQVDPPLPPRPVLAALPAGYRSPSAAAMLEIMHEVIAEWTDEPAGVDRQLVAVS